MKTSKEDTFISTEVLDFCEEKAPIPRNPHGSWDLCRKTGNYETLEFFDSPKMRTLIDASKQDNSHSDSANGKIELLTKRMATMKKANKSAHHIASFIQSSNLKSWQVSEPVYLHKKVGGLGAKPMFGNAINLYTYMITYRGGTRDRVYGTAVEEMKLAVREMDNMQPYYPRLCPLLRQNHGKLKHTYDDKVIIRHNTLQNADTNSVIYPLYRANEQLASYGSVENGMLKTRKI